MEDCVTWRTAYRAQLRQTGWRGNGSVPLTGSRRTARASVLESSSYV